LAVTAGSSRGDKQRLGRYGQHLLVQRPDDADQLGDDLTQLGDLRRIGLLEQVADQLHLDALEALLTECSPLPVVAGMIS
jgi:hypothetical protein